MAVKKAASFGKKARAIKNTPTGRAMARLVAPVAIERPTLLEKVDCPIPPINPARVVPADPARIPPATDFMSVRFHLLSLIFWHRVRSPTVFSTELRLAIRKGARNAKLKVIPTGKRWGKLTIGTARNVRNCDQVRMPVARAET